MRLLLPKAFPSYLLFLPSHPLGQELDEFAVIKSVKESSQIKVYDPHISVLHMFHGLPNCLAAVPIGSKPVAHICKDFLIFLTQYKGYSLRYKSVSYSGYLQGAFLTVVLRYVNQLDWRRSVCPRPDRTADFPRCSKRYPLSSSVLIPSTPDEPLLASTLPRAWVIFSLVSILSSLIASKASLLIVRSPSAL